MYSGVSSTRYTGVIVNRVIQGTNGNLSTSTFERIVFGQDASSGSHANTGGSYGSTGFVSFVGFVSSVGAIADARYSHADLDVIGKAGAST